MTTGDLGWIHQTNYLVAGVLMVLVAVGVRRVLRQGRGGLWGPRLLRLYGLAYISSGLFRADPVIGFSSDRDGAIWARSYSATPCHRYNSGERLHALQLIVSGTGVLS